jgi:hypothetical protein
MDDSVLKQYSGKWTDKELMHLLRRTLFGVTRQDYSFFKGKSMDECVEILLTPAQAPAPPSPLFRPDDNAPKGISFVFAPEFKENEEGRIWFLKGWWVAQMLDPQRSITEKMLLFWHNNLAVEFFKVSDSRYAYKYLCLLREHATGNFKKLVKEITTDPCMLVYLNGNINNRVAPNENYGRELQELFTVGKGPDSHYKEDDVKAAARILSGWKDDKKNISSNFVADDHNTDDKVFSAYYNNHTIKGRSGAEGARETDDLIEMLCGEKEVAKFLSRKLYRWFVSCNIDENVEQQVIAPLSEIIIKSGYEIKPALKVLFSSDFFYNPYLIGGMFKSPVDFMIGMLRVFNLTFKNDSLDEHYRHLFGVAGILRELGQGIGDPPSVAGWPAYYEYPIYDKNWITSENLSWRNKLAKLLSDPEASDDPLRFDFVGFASSFQNPGNAESLILDIWNAICSAPTSETKLAFMKNKLEPEQSSDKKWGELWELYQSDLANNSVKEEIFTRLRKVFDIIFRSPEFQIM